MIKNILRSTGFSFLLELRRTYRTFLKEKIAIQKRKAFYSQFINPHDLVFDVGANMGNRVAAFVSLDARVVAIEPQEICTEHLIKKFGAKIKIVAKGVGEKIGTSEFFVSAPHELSSFSQEWIEAVKKERFKQYEWNNILKVETTTLDDLIVEFGLPGFIKIDVEGYELEVLKGLNHRIRVISYEYTAPEQTDRAILCLERLREINPDSLCNYSVGESMKLALFSWVCIDDMVIHIKTEDFTNTRFGDIYVKGQRI